MVETRAPGTEQISQRVYVAGLVDGGGRPRALFQGKGQGRVGLAGTAELAWWTGGQGGGARAQGGGARASVPGQWGKVVPTGGLVDGGGRPRALVAGEGWGGRRGDGKFRNVCRIFVVFNAYKKKKNVFF